MTADSQRRSEKRVHTEMTVTLETGTGVTRDIAASGVFFSTHIPVPVVGTPISFTMQINHVGKTRILNVKGNVVRTEPRNGVVGVAVRISESEMEPLR